MQSSSSHTEIKVKRKNKISHFEIFLFFLWHYCDSFILEMWSSLLVVTAGIWIHKIIMIISYIRPSSEYTEIKTVNLSPSLLLSFVYSHLFNLSLLSSGFSHVCSVPPLFSFGILKKKVKSKVNVWIKSDFTLVLFFFRLAIKKKKKKGWRLQISCVFCLSTASCGDPLQETGVKISSVHLWILIIQVSCQMFGPCWWYEQSQVI